MTPPSPSLLIVSTVASTIRAFLLPYATRFRASDWRVDAMANGATTDPALVEAFDRCHEMPLSRSIRDLSGIVDATRAVRARLLADAYDIVHVHTPIASFVVRAAARTVPAERRPVVIYTAHGFHFHAAGHRMSNAVYRTAERVAGRATDRLIVINDEDERAARAARIVPAARLVRHPGIGIDTARFAPDAGERSARPRSIVSVSELSERKRPWDVVAALSAMEHRDAVLTLVGDGPERARVTDAIAEAGLESRVRLVGQVDDVRPILRAAQVFVLASDREGLARSIMEALAMEIPVVASDARGNRELVGDSGYVTPVADPRALASAIDAVLDDPAAAREMGRRGRVRMVEDYDVERVIRLHESLYADVLQERSRRSPH